MNIFKRNKKHKFLVERMCYVKGEHEHLEIFKTIEEARSFMIVTAFNFLKKSKDAGFECWDEICGANELAIRVKPEKKTETHRFIVTSIPSNYTIELLNAEQGE